MTCTWSTGPCIRCKIRAPPYFESIVAPAPELGFAHLHEKRLHARDDDRKRFERALSSDSQSRKASSKSGTPIVTVRERPIAQPRKSKSPSLNGSPHVSIGRVVSPVNPYPSPVDIIMEDDSSESEDNEPVHKTTFYEFAEQQETRQSMLVQQSNSAASILHRHQTDLPYLDKGPGYASSQEMRSILNHFFRNYMGDTCPHNPLRSALVPASMTSPTLRSTIPLTMTAFEDIDSGLSITPRSLEHRGIVIRLINDNLKDPITACADATICAITALMAFEYVRGARQEFEIHRAGLDDIVAMRGGIHKLGFDGALQRSILTLDALYNVLPRSGKSSKVRWQLPPEFSTFTYRREFALKDFFATDPRIIKILNMFHEFVVLAQAFGRPNISPDDIQDTFKRWRALKSKLLQLNSFHPGNKNATPADMKYESCRLAMVLFSSTVGDDFTMYQADKDRYVKRLKASLLKTDLHESWGVLPGALSWCLVTAINFSKEDSEWFLMYLVRTTVTYNLYCFREVVMSLQGIASGLRGAFDMQNSRSLAYPESNNHV